MDSRLYSHIWGFSDPTPQTLSKELGAVIFSYSFMLAKGMIQIEQLNEGALQVPARGGKMGVVKELLGKRANHSQHGNGSWTTLHWAAQGGHVEVVRELLTQGVELEAEDNDSLTPLHVAA